MATIETIIALAGAASSAGLGGFWVSARQNKRDEFRMIIDERKGQLDEMKAELHALKTSNEQLEKRIEGLENSREDFPFPMWQSDLRGDYVHVNRHFIEKVLAPIGRTAESIMGKRHEDVWSIAACEKLRTVQLAASVSPDKRARMDNVMLDAQFDDPVTIFKVPDYVRGILVGYTGYILDILPIVPTITNH